ncbi:hypothetical protein ACF0H5_017766 [Mactra antiquata]
MQLFVLLAALLMYCGTARASVCSYQASRNVTEEVKVGRSNCGPWGWGWIQCTIKEKRTRTEYYTDYKCCPGSYGSVGSGCTGECALDAEAISSQCQDETGSNRICRDNKCDKSGFLNSPAYTTFNENDNEERLVWSVNGTTFIQTANGGRRSRNTVSENVPIAECIVKSTNDIMEVRNGVDIYRKACSNPKCNPCGRRDVGCLDHNVNYEVKVTCFAAGYQDNGDIIHTFTLDIEEAEKVNFEFPEDVAGTPISVGNMSVGSVVLAVEDILIPNYEDVEIYIECPVSEFTNEPYFVWNDETQEILVAIDLTQEPAGEYTVRLCADQRRGDSCTEFTVVIEIPRTTTTTNPNTDFTVADETLTTSLPRCQPVNLPTPVPTKPPKLKPCKSVNIWANTTGMDYWCQVTCSTLDDDCRPYENHCICLNSTHEHLTCHARGNKWKGNEDMDAWCQLSCNYGNYSHCPTRKENKEGYCVCTEKQSESSTADQDDTQDEDSTESQDDDLTESPPEDSQTEIPPEYGSIPATGQPTSTPDWY